MVWVPAKAGKEAMMRALCTRYVVVERVATADVRDARIYRMKENQRKRGEIKCVQEKEDSRARVPLIFLYMLEEEME